MASWNPFPWPKVPGPIVEGPIRVSGCASDTTVCASRELTRDGEHYGHLYFLSDGTWNESGWPGFYDRTDQPRPTVHCHFSNLNDLLYALKKAGHTEITLSTHYINLWPTQLTK